jgi:hypothetical protein
MTAELDYISDYTVFIDEGNKYLKTARGGIHRPAIFTGEILYNIIGLAIEKHVMGALMAKGKLADNHTFTDLIHAADQVGGIDDAIAVQLRKFEGYQNLCPVFAGYQSATVSLEVIPEMIKTATAVQVWAQKIIAA